MKKTVPLLVMLLLVVVTAYAQEQEQEGFTEEPCFYEDNGTNNRYVYGKIFSGLNFLQHTTIDGNQTHYQTGYMVAGLLGYHWCGISLEGEYAFRRNGIEKVQFIQQGSSNDGYLQTSSYMANLIWDLPLSSCGCIFFWNIKPFIGAGIGYDSQRMHASNSRVIFGQKWQHFSWQLMAGFAYPLFCNTDITLEYKFHRGGSHFYNHVIGVGIEYKYCF